jgi:hypothetical protein
MFQNEVSPQYFLDFRLEGTQECFYACRMYCIRKITFSNLTRKDTTLSGWCFRALLDITFVPSVPRTDHQYTGSHSLHSCDVLLSLANHRAVSQVITSYIWWGFQSTQIVYNKRVKIENMNWTCDRNYLMLKNPAGDIPTFHLTMQTLLRYGFRRWVLSCTVKLNKACSHILPLGDGVVWCTLWISWLH